MEYKKYPLRFFSKLFIKMLYCRIRKLAMRPLI